jgi:hypothetical protein
MFPVSVLRNTVVPDARHSPANAGRPGAATTGPAAITGSWLCADGPVGVALMTLQAELNNVA